MTVRESTGCVDDIMMGRALVLMIASFHPNFGSKVASHGYPRRMSSFPMSVTRNRCHGRVGALKFLSYYLILSKDT